MSDVLGEILKDIENKSSHTKEPEMVSLDIARDPTINLHYAKQQIINHIDDMTDKELYSLIKTFYKPILEDIFIKDDKTYLEIISSSRFLSVFIQVINSVTLDSLEVTYCNKLSYDYLTMVNKSDDYIKSLYFSLSKTVNRNVINSLLGLKIEEELAAYLALARYSSTKEFINVRRLNHLLISQVPAVHAQTIVYIYEKLFDSITPLFEGIMFDRYEEDTLDNINACASDTYSNISLAIITILEGLPTDIITRVLSTYAGSYNISSANSEVRFPIRSISVGDYPRIISVVDFLEKNEMVIVP